MKRGIGMNLCCQRVRLKRERQAYEEAERENRNEWYSSSNYAGECEDYL